MSKHTPGPWDFSWEIQPNGCPTVGHKGLMVCMVAHSAKDPEQKETALANASLIAAAPDLLAALESSVSDLFYQIESKHGTEAASKYPSVVEGRAAIARAKGQSK